MARKPPDPVDVHVGARIRAARVQAGMSQGLLAHRLGITFQQVQKYEKGVNRVAPSRLAVVARVVGLPVAHFFDGVPEDGNPVDEQFARLTGFVSTREGVELNRAFTRIRSARTRRDVIQLVSSLAGADDAR